MLKTINATPLAPDDARDEVLVEELAGIINAAYAIGEAGLWLEGTTRIRPAEVAEAIRSGGMLVATRKGRPAGCAYVRPLEPGTADLGLISTAPDQWGGGVGSELVRSAEELMRSQGVTTMQLEVLVPTEGVHAQKELLCGWYSKLGYRVVRPAPFEEVVSEHLVSRLAVPCEFLIFHKRLA